VTTWSGEQGVRRQAVAYNLTNWKLVTTEPSRRLISLQRVSDGGPGEQGVRRQAVTGDVTNWKFVTTEP
jgi:hypothetical protein